MPILKIKLTFFKLFTFIVRLKLLLLGRLENIKISGNASVIALSDYCSYYTSSLSFIYMEQKNQHLNNVRVAVIEDELSICEMYKMKLINAGFNVKVAHDGQEGLILLKEFKPALILLDLKMPIMSGDEMLARLRETEWGSEIRVIVLTNISRDEAPRTLQFLNIDRYIVKAHHTPTQIINIVQEILG